MSLHKCKLDIINSFSSRIYSNYATERLSSKNKRLIRFISRIFLALKCLFRFRLNDVVFGVKGGNGVHIDNNNHLKRSE